MKKVYKLFSIAAFCMGMVVGATTQVSAQAQVNNTVSSHRIVRGSTSAAIPSLPHHSIASSASTETYLMNSAVANDSVNGFNGHPRSVLHTYPLFPDSEGVFDFSNGSFYTIINLIGNVFDPLAANMQFYYGNTAWNNFTSYTVDTVLIPVVYTRTINNGVADTLVVYLYTNADTNNLTTNYFVHAGAYEMNFGVTDTIHDTLQWKQMYYDYTTNMPSVESPNQMLTAKYRLTVADTGISFIAVPTTGFSVGAGQILASAVGFIPGYSYNNGDDITTTKNQLKVFAYEENGNGVNSAGTYPTYNGVGGQKDWNASGVVTTSERYNLSGNPTNGEFESVWEFGQSWPLEEWDIYYQVTSLNVGFKESVASSGLKLYQNQPNPANGTSLIKYETKTAGAVTFDVTDLTGRVIMELNEGFQSAGDHFIPLEVSTLSQGMYLYTLRSNGESLTKRMVIGQ